MEVAGRGFLKAYQLSGFKPSSNIYVLAGRLENFRV